MRFVALLCLLAWVTTGSAQPYPGPVLAAAASYVPNTPGYVGQLSFQGNSWTTLVVIPDGALAVAMAPGNRDLLVSSSRKPGLFYVDRVTGTISATLGMTTYVHDIEPMGNGTFALLESSNGRTSDLSILDVATRRITTIATGLPLANAIIEDCSTGDFLIGLNNLQGQGPSLLRVQRDGSASTVWMGVSLYVGEVAQDPVDGGIWVHAANNQLNTYPLLKLTGRDTYSTIMPNGPTYPNGLAIDRAAGAGQIVMSSRNVYRVALGAIPQVVGVMNAQLGFGWAHNGLTFDQSRNLAGRRIGQPNRWALDLDFPTEPGRGYLLGISATGFSPGISIGGGRTIPLVADAVAMLSVSGGLAPYLQSNAGRLSANGRGIAVLDLSAFGASLSGIRLWAAAITLDPAAPSGVATIAKPIVLVLD